MYYTLPDMCDISNNVKNNISSTNNIITNQDNNDYSTISELSSNTKNDDRNDV